MTMTHRPQSMIRRIGNEQQPIIVIDGFSPDPDALRDAAIATRFERAGQHYPGIRAPLPGDYLRVQLPIIAKAIGRIHGPCRRVHVLDASFSIVTDPPERLHVRQRMPHVDAYGAERIALVHYLAPQNEDGTAFYRHRSTDYETVDEARAPMFFERIDAELRGDGLPPAAYVAGDTALFEQTAMVEAQYDRAVIYRSYLLHSGAISPRTMLSSDPAKGRLTITAFLAVE